MPIRRPCLNCRQLTTNPTRCTTCHSRRQALIDAHRTRSPPHQTHPTLLTHHLGTQRGGASKETLEDIHPIRLKDANPNYTEKQYQLASAILKHFPHIRPGQRHKASREFRKQVRQAGIKYDTNDLRPALDAIHMNRTSDPLGF